MLEMPGPGDTELKVGERSEPNFSGGSPGPNAPPKVYAMSHETIADPEVPEKAIRRRFTAAYKLKILRQADSCTKQGEIGALLRREGLYASLLSSWRQSREKGVLGALTPKKRGRKAKVETTQGRRVKELERENRRLQRRLEQAQTIIEFQKKVSDLLGIPLRNPGDDEKDL